MRELYRTVTFNDKYECSNLGNIRNKDTKRTLTPKDDSYGYLQVGLCFDGGKKKTIKVHRIVGECFLGPKPANLETSHSNQNKYDCRAVNLSYQTKATNQQMAYAAGLKPTECPRKLDSEDAIEIRKLCRLGLTNVEIAKRFKVSPNFISMIKTGKRYKDC